MGLQVRQILLLSLLLLLLLLIKEMINQRFSSKDTSMYN